MAFSQIAMSHTVIAAVLARMDLPGERLAALSLASFANGEQRAWPGNPAAAARAGLGRSRYLQARGQLVVRRLLGVEGRGSGRGQATTMVLLFAQSGPWWDAEINAPLLERVLGYSRARGPARLLLATLAALSDDSGTVDDSIVRALRGGVCDGDLAGFRLVTPLGSGPFLAETPVKIGPFRPETPFRIGPFWSETPDKDDPFAMSSSLPSDASMFVDGRSSSRTGERSGRADGAAARRRRVATAGLAPRAAGSLTRQRFIRPPPSSTSSTSPDASSAVRARR